MTVTFSPTVGPSYSSSGRTTPHVRLAKFGDGYEQRVADGINNMADTFNLRWENLTKAEFDYLIAFFKARGGTEAFFWTPPGEVSARKFKTDGAWDWTYEDTGVWSVSVVFQEVFDI